MATLINDYGSADKEWIDLCRSSKKSTAFPPSAVYYILKSQDVTYFEAKEMVKNLLPKMESELVQECQLVLDNCRDFEKALIETYLSSVQYAVAGLAVPEYKSCDFHSLVEMKNLKQGNSNILGKDISDNNKNKDNCHISLQLNENNGVITPPWLTIFPNRSEEVVMEPFNYISKIAATGNKIRKHVVESLNIWYKVPEDRLKIIMDVSDLLRNSLVMRVL
ncbi:hypothetical protein AA313_de0209694 [Arthrobotrys entomopaga]|nr:hypothetical protein AA313_de0209694 [Arthrobotrys entomopaga]